MILKVKWVLTALLFSSYCGLAFAKSDSSGSTTNVNGYTKKDGTYVPPHKRTNPNHTQRDNWSSKPNYNPYTGKEGKKEPQK
jgi:hypothetical protein